MGKQRHGESGSAIKALLLGILFSLAVFLITALAAGAVLSATEDPTASLATVSLGAFGLSGLVSGFILASRRRSGGVILSILTALALTLLLLLVGILLTGGHLPGRAMMNHLCYLLIASFGALLGGMRTRKPRRHGTRRKMP